MNKVLPLISLFIISIISIFYWTLKSKNELYDAKWNAPDTTLAITINGEISTTFPTTNAYTGIVECTTGTGKVEWNGSKWVLTTSGITKGSTKCNATFVTAAPAPDGWYDAGSGTLLASLRDNNELEKTITTPGEEVSAHVVNDAENATLSMTSGQNYYITYGTDWVANGTNFDLTGAKVTSDTYAKSYSTLVGKYLPSDWLGGIGSSTVGETKTTTNLHDVYYVVSATPSSFTYKGLSSTRKTTEALMASAEDDYGTSYYFRGAVKNNYVEFANKCWRIVRITGDGNIKLVLHNDNTGNLSSPCKLSNNSDTAALAHYNVSTYETAFNTNHADNAYVGFMYGTAGSSNYASTHANTNKSTILTNLETWYKNNLSSYESKLADTIWCNDKSTVSGGLGYGTNQTRYGSYNRISLTKAPTLKCPSDNNGGKLSKFTVDDSTNGNGNLTYKIGLLTIDEATYAGCANTYDNYATYLQENAINVSWWSLSPNRVSSSAAVWYVYSGNLSFNSVNWSSGLRPVISLVSSTMVTGSGTSEDPYVVE